MNKLKHFTRCDRPFKGAMLCSRYSDSNVDVIDSLLTFELSVTLLFREYMVVLLNPLPIPDYSAIIDYIG